METTMVGILAGKSQADLVVATFASSIVAIFAPGQRQVDATPAANHSSRDTVFERVVDCSTAVSS